MARRPAAVPPELLERPFRGVDAVQAGLLTAGQLRHGPWVRIMRGIYAQRDLAGDPAVRLGALRLATAPGDVVCGRTAAWLHRVWTPRPGVAVPLEVTRPLGARADERLGEGRRRLVLRRAAPAGRPLTGISVLDEDVLDLDGLAVLSPLRTCFDMVRERRLVEAVVVMDAFLYAGAVHLEHLAAYCSDRRRWPGVRQARVAVSLATAAARSPGETRLRMILVLGGLEEPLVNVPVLDDYDRHVATPDLQVRGRRWAWLEYDGSYHEAQTQHLADVRRENRLAVETGVPILRYDRHHMVGEGPERVLGEVVRATAAPSPQSLDPRDFWRPAVGLQW